ncbi:MAG: hypothetical protein WAN28_08135, partial [Terracidiphilus sp.]
VGTRRARAPPHTDCWLRRPGHEFVAVFLLPQSVVATVIGLSGLAADLVGAGFTFPVGALVDRFS